MWAHVNPESNLHRQLWQDHWPTCQGCLFRSTAKKTVGRCWRIISARFKRRLNPESLKVKFHVIVANIDSVSWLLLNLSGTSTENYTETRPLFALHRSLSWAKTRDFWRWEVRRWSFTAAETSLHQVFVRFDKGKTFLAGSYLCRYVSRILLCNSTAPLVNSSSAEIMHDRRASICWLGQGKP